MKKGGNMKVSVSVLKEYDRLITAVKKVNESNADYLHVDVMDGIFVKNKKFPYEVSKEVISISTKKIDMHLMVNDENAVLKYSNLEPDIITFHVEILKDKELIKLIKSKGIKVGLAINPNTSIDKLMPYVNDIDLVLFMSVEPGLGGQEFIESVIDKIKEFKKKAPSSLIINIDGGVNDKTISLCKYAGCDMVVSGSYITNSNNYNDNINKLRES